MVTNSIVSITIHIYNRCESHRYRVHTIRKVASNCCRCLELNFYVFSLIINSQIVANIDREHFECIIHFQRRNVCTLNPNNELCTTVPAMALEMKQQRKQNSGIIQLDELCCAIILMQHFVDSKTFRSNEHQSLFFSVFVSSTKRFVVIQLK